MVTATFCNCCAHLQRCLARRLPALTPSANASSVSATTTIAATGTNASNTFTYTAVFIAAAETLTTHVAAITFAHKKAAITTISILD